MAAGKRGKKEKDFPLQTSGFKSREEGGNFCREISCLKKGRGGKGNPGLFRSWEEKGKKKRGGEATNS